MPVSVIFENLEACMSVEEITEVFDTDPGVVDQNVDAAEMSGRLLHQSVPKSAAVRPPGITSQSGDACASKPALGER